jgi:hypothetical protein
MLLVGVAATSLACSSAASEELGLTLAGSYEAEGPGELHDIRFPDSTRYLLVRNQPCTMASRTALDAKPCEEDGTYALSGETLTLTAHDGSTRALALHSKDSRSADSNGLSMHPLGAGTGLVVAKTDIVKQRSDLVITKFELVDGEPTQMFHEVVFSAFCESSNGTCVPESMCVNSEKNWGPMGCGSGQICCAWSAFPNWPRTLQ